MANDNRILKAIIAVSMIGIISIIGLIIGNKGVTTESGFTELYFENPGALPTKMRINNTYIISFTLTSHENNPMRYRYKVESRIKNSTGQISLSPGDSKNISIELKPKRIKWTLHNTRYRKWIDHINLTKNSWIARPIKLESIMAGNTTTSLLGFIQRLPLIHKLDYYGAVLLTNVSVDELQRKPLYKRYEYQDTNELRKYIKRDAIDLRIKDDVLILDRELIETWYNKSKEKLEISVVSEKGDEYSIHFWYSVS